MLPFAALALDELDGAVLTEVVRPRATKATVCCGLFKGSRFGGFTEMLATICVGTRVELTPNWFALPRRFVMRMIRVPEVPGGSIGTPKNVTWLFAGEACLEHVRTSQRFRRRCLHPYRCR